MYFYHQPPFNVLMAFSLLPGCKKGMGLPCLPREGRGFTHLKGDGWTKHVSYLHQPLQKSAGTQELLCHGQVSFTNLAAKTLCTLLGCRAKNAPPETPAKLLPGRTNMNELTGKAFALLIAFNHHQPDSYSLLIYVSQKDAVFPVVLLLQRVVPIFCLYQAGEERKPKIRPETQSFSDGASHHRWSLMNILTALEQIGCRRPDPASFGSSHRYGSSRQDSVESRTRLGYGDV